MKPTLRLLLVVCFLAARFAAAQSNLVLFLSAPGDYVGGGVNSFTTNQAAFAFNGSPTYIGVGAFGYGFKFAPGSGAVFAVGTYSNTLPFPVNGSSPGMDISGNGRGCNTECGWFQVLEFHTNSAGAVDHLWLVYSNLCECGAAPMTGEIRYQSLLAPSPPPLKTIRVPADYATIQGALNASSIFGGDTVLVAPGTYNESLNFYGRGTRLLATGGPANTFLSSPASQNAVRFISGESSNAVLAGFTISSGGAAGVYASVNSNPTVRSNTILNSAYGLNLYGASIIAQYNLIVSNTYAVFISGGSNALIQGNTLQYNANGVYLNGCGQAQFNQNWIAYNRGDAFYGINDADPDIYQNVIYSNAGNAVSFLVPTGSRGPVVVNNTIAGNKYGISISGYDGASQVINNLLIGPGAVNVTYYNSSTTPLFLNNDIYSATGGAYTGVISNLAGANGNLSLDPHFVCLLGADLRLLPGSPVIDAGTNGAVSLPSTDFLGNPRNVAGGVGPALVDLGAYEARPAFPLSPCLYALTTNVFVIAVPGQNSAVANYPTISATPDATLAYNPPSGSVFSAGTNQVLATVSYGTNLFTTNFSVIVLIPPFLTNQPTLVTAAANSNVTLTVGALGSSIGYQWFFEGHRLTNAGGNTLSLPLVQVGNEGYYQVVVTNSLGSYSSLPIELRVLPTPPNVLTNPAPSVVPAGGSATFQPVVLGSAPFSFQWFKDGGLLPGATGLALNLTNVQAGQAGWYQLGVTNALGGTLGLGASLTVTSAPPVFVQQPLSLQTLAAGSNLVLNVLARGTDDAAHPLSYAWYSQGKLLVGATNARLALVALGTTNQGSYYAVAANSYGVATSLLAQVIVYAPPSLTAGLSNQLATAGGSIVLGVTAVGSAPLSYAWKWNVAVIGAGTGSLVLSNATVAQSGFYSVIVSNAYGTVSSRARLAIVNPTSRVLAWGDDALGQLDFPGNLVDAVAVAGGDYHTVVLRQNGMLVAAGANDQGQTSVPTNALPFVAVAAGANHNLAIALDGGVVAWGRNDAGQTTVPAGATPAVAVAAGQAHSLTLLPTGAVVVWGDNTYGQTNPPLVLLPGAAFVSSTAIAAGRNHSLARLSSGQVVAWGDNGFGQSTAPSNNFNIVAVAAGNLHSLALTGTGKVLAWGNNSYGQTNVPVGIPPVVAVAAGEYHSLALCANGQVFAWGDNSSGQINVPAAAFAPAAVAAGYYTGFALQPVQLTTTLLSIPGGFVLQWPAGGTLQTASTPAGPFTDFSTLGTSFTNTHFSLPSQFYRVRW